MRRRDRIVLASVMLVPIALGSCSLGPREQWAEAIHDAYDKARAAGRATVKQANTVSSFETAIEEEPEVLVAKAAGVVDFATRRATMREQGGRKAEIAFDDLLTFLPRSKAAIAEGSPERITYFDFEAEPSEEIDDNDRRTAIGAGALVSPSLAIELLDGVLTGSIDRVGSGMKAGVTATRYSARLAPDSAVRDVDDEDRRSGILRVFESLGVREDLFPIDVWLDEQGLVRGLRFTMRQQKDRVNAYNLTTSWEFRYDGATEPKVPSRSDAHRSRRMREFIVEFIRESG